MESFRESKWRDSPMAALIAMRLTHHLEVVSFRISRTADSKAVLPQWVVVFPFNYSCRLLLLPFKLKYFKNFNGYTFQKVFLCKQIKRKKGSLEVLLKINRRRLYAILGCSFLSYIYIFCYVCLIYIYMGCGCVFLSLLYYCYYYFFKLSSSKLYNSPGSFQKKIKMIHKVFI